MSEALDKEWLAGCEPHVLEKIDKWFKEPRVTTAIDVIVSAKAEITSTKCSAFSDRCAKAGALERSIALYSIELRERST